MRVFGTFIYWGLLNSEDDDIYELVGVFDEEKEAQRIADITTKELQEKEGHSFAHGIVKDIILNVNQRGKFKA